jgi:competence ComEA-like helix-hairpin-helix protein
MMNVWKRLSQGIGFTPTERRVVVFLTATFLVGIAVKMVRVALETGPAFDYSASDAAFARAARAPAPADTVHAAAARGDSLARAPGRTSVRKKEVPAGSVNINTARKELLMSLPGIGETMADRIVQYRKDHGPFTTLEDLMNVKGIGKKKFARIAPSCTTGK